MNLSRKKFFIKNFLKMIIGYFLNIKNFKNYDENTIFFIGVPEYGNLGDQAIAKAEINFLKKILPESEIVVITEKKSMENLLCIKKTTNKFHNICTFIGGGNMGDLYFFQENLRLTAIKLLKKGKIIIFPQSIDYNGTSKRYKKAKKIYESHDNLFLFTREKNSEKKRKLLFPMCKGGLVPDIVLSLEPKIEKITRNGIYFCLRNDIEKNDKSLKIITELENFSKKLNFEIKKIDTSCSKYCTKYEKQNMQLTNFLKEFSKANIIITDRLHGMIFSVITNTPCVAFDNTTGKNKSLYNTWLNKEMVCFIDNINDIEKAKYYIKKHQQNNQYNKNYLNEINKYYKILEKSILDFYQKSFK